MKIKTWPTASVVAVVTICATGLLLAGPSLGVSEEAQAWALGVLAIVGSLIAGALGPMLGKRGDRG